MAASVLTFAFFAHDVSGNAQTPGRCRATRHRGAWQWTALPSTSETLFDTVEERALHLVPPPAATDRVGPGVAKSEKKIEWLVDKARRARVHVTDEDLRRAGIEVRRRNRAQPVRGEKPVDPSLAATPHPLPPIGTRFQPLVTLFNLKTREALPVLPGPRLPGARPDRSFCTLLRDHFTNQATAMDLMLFEALTMAARHFEAPRIDIVSGYRSPKYNLTLRKKGREVASSSRHTQGQAVDFRVQGVPTEKLVRFVRSLRMGGVGYYPHSQFVHCDTGPVRFWRGS